MKIKNMKKIVSLCLALLMILPVISIPAVAAEASSPTVIWAGDNFEGTSPWGNIKSKPTSATVATEANGNHAIRFESKGVQGGTYNSAYYVANKDLSASKTKFYVVSNVVENTDGTVSGSVVIDSATYTFTSQTADKNAAITLSPALSGYTLYSGAGVDAFFGSGNVATPVKTKSPAISYSDYSKVVFECRYYFGEGTKGTFASRARSSDNGWVELFGVLASGSTVAIQAHENAQIVEGAAKIVSTNTWVTVSVLLDMSTGMRYVYVNGDIAFSATNKSGVALTTPITVKENTWDLLQLNRNNRTPNLVDGYVMMDDMKIYDGSAFSTEIIAGFKDTYEQYSLGTKITTAWGYNTNKPAEIVAYNKVLADADGNKFVRVPVVYDEDQGITTAGYTNSDKTLMINNPALSANDEFMILDISYRPHGNETDIAETIELQLRSFNFDLKVADGSVVTPKGGTAAAITEDVSQKAGHYCTLFFINLNTGALSFGTHGFERTGAAGLVQDEWNDIRYILNLKNATATVLVNGEVYATIPSMILTGTNWDACTNGSNLTIPGGNIIISKVNKTNTASFLPVQDADENYSNVNYVDIDNVDLTTKTSAEIIADFNPEKYDGIVTTEQKSSIRHTAPTGLRFATLVNEDMLDELHALIGDALLGVAFGTLIVPEDYLTDGTEFTVEALEAAGKKYLNVEATHGAYFKVDDDASTTHFVGSIVNILDGNETRPFAGIGYVKATLMTGAEYYFYSPVAYVTDVQQTAQKVLDTTDISGYTTASKKAIEAFAAGTSLNSVISADMSGLNVLALGDSLFAGTDEGTPGCDRGSQWVNLLGNNHGWNLTNLGIGGMTVSYTGANYTTKGHKASMYHWLFEDVNDFRWGSGTTSFPDTNRIYYNYNGTDYGYNSYYQCGDFTGKTAEDVDLIILEGGCNDYGYEIAAPLGTITSQDPATFLGAWNCITEKLLEDYPNAKIVFITTWYLNPQSRPDNLTSIEFSTSINTLYEEIYASNDRVYLIDAGNPDVSGVDMLDAAWRTEYSNDSYHLKNNGMAVMAGNMLPRLWEIWVNATATEE
ncbi:MAG: SGNH/GDSL hydrolase family protein [Clostridia bacterium]|nr:SGNH/GDSL hydrolase family protein [Clostridia bacterium]